MQPKGTINKLNIPDYRVYLSYTAVDCIVYASTLISMHMEHYQPVNSDVSFDVDKRKNKYAPARNERGSGSSLVFGPISRSTIMARIRLMNDLQHGPEFFTR